MITISVDEKPGIRVIKNIATDLPPKPEVSATRAETMNISDLDVKFTGRG